LKRQPPSPQPIAGRGGKLEDGAADQRTTLDLLLGATATHLHRYVVLSPEQADAATLWAAHTHAMDAWRHTPYLRIYSVVKQSGKTRLLEVLHPLCANPLDTDGITPAALIRTVDAEHPTLLLDEVDAQLGSSREMAEALRGILNSGFRRRGNFMKCVGEGGNITTRKFSTFCPKALAGIGRLPDTVADRSIPIRLKRRAGSEQVELLYEEDWEATARPIANGFADELAPKISDLVNVRPEPVGGLSDRAEEAWRPLLARRRYGRWRMA
jgi:Protein of unknown function (DUF3631)